MRKLLLLFLFVLIQNNLIFAQTDSSRELAGFRKAKWGSTINEVKFSEKEHYLQAFSGFGIYALSYTSKLAGLKTRIDYTFKNGKLVEGSFTFNSIENIKNDFIILNNFLTGEYGKPNLMAGPSIESNTLWIQETKFGKYKGPELYWKFTNGFIALIASRFEDEITLTILYTNSKSIEEYNRDREVSTEDIF